MTGVEVTQADREAAAKVLPADWRSEAPLVVAGRYDSMAIVQAFAAHRLAAIEQCAKVCDGHARNAFDIAASEGQNIPCASGRNQGARFCATAIRALKEPSA